MSHEIRVPRLGWSMEEGTFIRWLKEPGASVRVGEPLFELEGEKATQAIESLDAGVLHLLPDAPAPGALVAVGTLLGYLLAPGEMLPVASPKPTATPECTTPRQASSLPTNPSTMKRPIASPRAKRVAKELGVDWTILHGSGRAGRIREVDVTAQAAQRFGAGAAGDPGASGRRRTIAARLRISQERTVPVTLTTTVDATCLVALRDQFKAAAAGIVPTYTDLVACIMARVLIQHPHMAACRENVPLNPAQTAREGLNIGIAVHTDEGLVAPVVRGVGCRTLVEIAEQSKTLIQRARAGTLTAAEMQGGVFTITSLGAYGIEAFTPVINYPELAILGLGAIRREAVVLPDGAVAPRERMTLSLTFDHAVIDGVPAAAFLRDVAAAVATPAVAMTAHMAAV